MQELTAIEESVLVQRNRVKQSVIDMAREREAGVLKAIAYSLIGAANELTPCIEPTDEDRQEAMGVGQSVLESMAADLPCDVERAVHEYDLEHDLENDEFLIDDIRAELRSELKELGEKY